MQSDRTCNLSPLQHMKLNSIANFLILVSFIVSLNITWFEYKSSEFSLTQINMKNSSWKSFGDFKKLCNEKNLNKYKDLPDDCELLARFQLAGTLYIIMVGFAMIITIYNFLSAAAKGWGLDMKFLDYQVRIKQFPHVIAPVAYTVAIIIWIISLNVGFTSEFYAQLGFYLADFTTAGSFGVAVHHTIFFRFFDEKEDLNILIN